MRIKTIITIFAMALCAIPAAIADPPQESPTIDALLPEQFYPELRAILAAIETNAPGLQTHAYYAAEADERYKQAKARRYLNAKLFSNFGPRQKYYQSGNADDTSSFTMNAGINLYRPIYHWGAIEAGIKQAQLGDQAAEMEFERKRSDLTRNLRADFLNLHLTEQAYQNEVQQQEITDEKIKRAELQHQSGKISEVDLRSIRLEKEQSLLSLEQISTQKEQITQRFKINYGWAQPLNTTGPIPQIEIKHAMSWLNAEKKSLSRSAVHQLYPIQQQLNALHHHKEQQVIIAANDRPLVNLFLSGVQGQTNTSTNNDVSTFTFTGGINVNWNIFDGFRTRHQKMEAKIKQRRLKAQLENSVNELLLEQQRILNALRLRLRELNILEQQFSIQTEQHLNAQKDLQAGRITEPQLQASALALESMRYKLYKARANTLMGISDYKEFTRLTTSEE
jgi:outer membrane protein TolC